MKMMMEPFLNIVIKGKVVSICMVKMVHCEVLKIIIIHLCVFPLLLLLLIIIEIE